MLASFNLDAVDRIHRRLDRRRNRAVRGLRDHKARLEDREVTEQDLMTSPRSMVPLSRTMKEQISHIRSWAFERAVKASCLPVGR